MVGQKVWVETSCSRQVKSPFHSRACIWVVILVSFGFDGDGAIHALKAAFSGVLMVTQFQ